MMYYVIGNRDGSKFANVFSDGIAWGLHAEQVIRYSSEGAAELDMRGNRHRLPDGCKIYQVVSDVRAVDELKDPSEMWSDCHDPFNEADGGSAGACEDGALKLGELPGLASDLRRWESSLCLCGIIGLMDGTLDASQAAMIREKRDEVVRVREFIEKGCELHKSDCEG